MPQSPHQVTSTGIRIVGDAARRLAAEAAQISLATPADSDAVWAARFRVRPRLGKGSPVPAILEAISAALHEEWDACPPLTRNRPFSQPPGRFRGIVWDVVGEPGTWRGELLWRHQHPRLAGTPATTRVVIDEQQERVTLTLVALADGGVAGVRGIVGAGQSQPKLLETLRRTVVLSADGHEGAPIPLEDLEIAPFVREVMLGDDRAWPVAVLTPSEQGGFLVPPEQLAAELFGLAPLYVIQHHSGTFRLTDAIGDRRLSAYWGALRIYRPEFSCADRSDDHWLLLRDRVEDPLERALVLGQLAQATMHRALPVEGVAERRAALTVPVAAAPVVRAPVAPVEPEPAEAAAPATPAPAPAAPPVPPLVTPAAPLELVATLGELPTAIGQLAMQVRDLAGVVGHLVTINAQLADEIARLRTATAIRASGTQSLERRLARIESGLFPEADTEEQTPAVPADEGEDEREAMPTLLDTVRQAASEYSDALLMLDSAEVSAADSPFTDVDRVAAVLQAMAYVSRRRQEGGLGTGLRAAFQELGVDYRSQIGRTTSDKLRQQYRFAGPDGTIHECHEHIAIGGGTYDPRHVLRIYFTSRAAAEPRFVVGHVGRHLTVMSST